MVKTTLKNPVGYYVLQILLLISKRKACNRDAAGFILLFDTLEITIRSDRNDPAFRVKTLPVLLFTNCHSFTR